MEWRREPADIPGRGGGALPPRTQLYELTGSHLASPIDTRRGVARERAAQRPGTWRCASASFLFRRVDYLPSLAGGRSSDAVPHRGGGHRTASQCATLSGISNTARALDRSLSTTAPHRRRGGACWLGFVRDRRRAARTQLDMGGRRKLKLACPAERDAQPANRPRAWLGAISPTAKANSTNTVTNPLGISLAAPRPSSKLPGPARGASPRGDRLGTNLHDGTASKRVYPLRPPACCAGSRIGRQKKQSRRRFGQSLSTAAARFLS